MAGVERGRGRGRGNLGARERVWGRRLRDRAVKPGQGHNAKFEGGGGGEVECIVRDSKIKKISLKHRTYVRKFIYTLF